MTWLADRGLSGREGEEEHFKRERVAWTKAREVAQGGVSLWSEDDCEVMLAKPRGVGHGEAFPPR